MTATGSFATRPHRSASIRAGPWPSTWSSATVAAQGYRFRVPYGTLLCVSDKPLHGELKLPGQANAFYERAISQHLRIGIETLTLLQREGEDLHSRKLRSFDEPPLR